jgi:hypothetical protein
MSTRAQCVREVTSGFLFPGTKIIILCTTQSALSVLFASQVWSIIIIHHSSYIIDVLHSSKPVHDLEQNGVVLLVLLEHWQVDLGQNTNH